MKSYDLVIVGGGPGGYTSALRAAKLGLSVALVEKDHLGGTCLNRGCIPSKTLLHGARIVDMIEKGKRWGIETAAPLIHFDQMRKHKDAVIQRLRTGIDSMLKAGKIDQYRGHGTVHPDLTVTVRSQGEETAICGKHILLATGSQPSLPPIPGLEQTEVRTSDTIFDIDDLPESIVIVGGGVIGLEFADIFSSLRAKVTVVEMAERILATEDADAAKVVEKHLKSKGVKFFTSAKVASMRQDNGRKIVSVQTADGTVELAAAEILVAVGRRPNLDGLEPLGLRMNGPFVAVDEYLQTNLPNVYAVGDLIGGWQLAHVATAEGFRAVDNIAKKKEKMDYRAVPRCLYTSPEIASVGLGEQAARERGYDVQTATFPLAGIGKAVAVDESDGFMKLIADRKYGEILGVVLVGPHVTEMINEASAYMVLEGTVEEMARMIHPHPTISEIFFEAADLWLKSSMP
jgi:dihydrolipoamide dehydrogenase